MRITSSANHGCIRFLPFILIPKELSWPSLHPFNCVNDVRLEADSIQTENRFGDMGSPCLTSLLMGMLIGL